MARPDAARLLERAAELVDVPSVSRDEHRLADIVERELAAAGTTEVTRVGDNVVARTAAGRGRRLLLGGHLDTVPPSGNAAARLHAGRLYGCGSADMKGGVAILLELARVFDDPVVDVTLLLYAREEIARAESGLLELEAARPDLLEADAAVLLEPTNAVVEAGCQGVIRADVVLGGRRAHSARPWAGRNAIHRLAPLMETLSTYEERMPVIDGCTYHESLQAVGVRGGVAGNVVPDEASVSLSFRFAPDRGVDDAERSLRSLLARVLDTSLDSVTIVDAAAAARPNLAHELLAPIVDATGTPPVAKLGYTDVAFFAERGVPALNFGPGDPLVAHGPDEHVAGDELSRVYDVLSGVVNGVGSDARAGGGQ